VDDDKPDLAKSPNRKSTKHIFDHVLSNSS
jgi:hypothetical protein